MMITTYTAGEPEPTTLAEGEEDPQPTTLALGEEDSDPTTLSAGEEDDPKSSGGSVVDPFGAF